MPFRFYARHEHHCPNVSRCPHLGGAALGTLVLLRKITYGHRIHAGAVRRGRLMTVAETAKRHGHRPSDIYQGLLPTTTTARTKSAVVTGILAHC